MIDRVAIMQGGVVYSLPKPNRHDDVVRHMMLVHHVSPVNGEQGFIDNRAPEIFINREAASKLAVETGQLKEIQVVRGKRYRKLYSEDLW